MKDCYDTVLRLWVPDTPKILGLGYKPDQFPDQEIAWGDGPLGRQKEGDESLGKPKRQVSEPAGK